MGTRKTGFGNLVKENIAGTAFGTIQRANELARIIADVRAQEGFDPSSIRLAFDAARNTEGHSSMVVLPVSEGQVELKVKWMSYPATLERYNKRRDNYFYTTLAGLSVGEEELRELCE